MSNEQNVLELTYSMDVNGRTVTTYRLWYPDANDAKENLMAVLKESSRNFIQIKLKRAPGW